MQTRTIDAAHFLPSAEADIQREVRLTIDNGHIKSVSPIEPGTGNDFVLPAFVDAHDHARVARLSQVGSYDTQLEAWLPYLTLIPAVDPYLSSTVAFGRVATSGVASVMAHYTRVQGLTDLPTEAAEVARAARDVGVKLALALHCRDLNPLVYGDHSSVLNALTPTSRETISRRFLKDPLSVERQVEQVEEIAAQIEGDGVTIQYGPAGVQWCSDAMLRAISKRSAQTGRRVHMHLLETRYQRAWADRTFPQGIVTYLDEIGLLNDRVSFAHCVHLRPDEMDLIAERGATIITNISSNLLVASGMPPVGEMVRRGCRVAMGLDGLAFDEDEDQFREMRLVYNGQKALGFDRSLTPGKMLDIAVSAGHAVNEGNFSGGTLAVGQPADLMVLDWSAMSADLVERDVSPLQLLMAKGTKRVLKSLVVGGRTVFADNRLTGVDLAGNEAALLDTMRAAHDQVTDVRAAMPELKAALEAFYVSQN
ncbi:amidohydrolase family protein [Pelagibacterium luteolum]|uniref:Cytosine/adenosine deaminase n=1 Tax=Pelagibacterium luteolum TaxID=440168 RepID=A0A1G7SXW0_9HYPH|nr:amidohydrolase family protein [Pelagibacterium luteolum]SDG27915.1 Cytosine/adenosine deaminase [Pelagibacterium luteolum]